MFFLKTKKILTAAHCIRKITNQQQTDTPASSLSVTSTSKFQIVEEKRWQVLQYYIHPTYVNSQASADRVDIALLRVETISFTSDVQSIVLARSIDSSLWSPGSVGVVSGFGTVNGDSRTSQFEQLSQTLQAVDVPIVSEATCSTTRTNNNVIVNWQILCAGSQGKDACAGDSGGPLVVSFDNRPVLIGVVSASTIPKSNAIQCGAPNEYGTYAIVGSYRSWIESVTGALPSLSSVPNVQGVPPSITFTSFAVHSFQFNFVFFSFVFFIFFILF